MLKTRSKKDLGRAEEELIAVELMRDTAVGGRVVNRDRRTGLKGQVERFRVGSNRVKEVRPTCSKGLPSFSCLSEPMNGWCEERR